MITTILLCIVLVVVLTKFMRSAYKKPKNFPPGPPSLPIWGAYWIIITIDNCLSKAFLKLGKFYNTNIVGMYLGPFKAITVNDYPTIREVLYRVDLDGRMDILLARARSYYKKLGIFFTDGDNWMVQRRFALRNMRDFGFGRRCPNLEAVIDNEVKETFESCITGPVYEYEKEIIKGDLVRLPDIFVVPSLNGMMAVFMQETLPRSEYDKLWKLATAGLLFQRSSDDTGRSLNITPWLKDVLPNYCGYNDMVKGNQVFLEFFEERIKKHNETFDENNDRNFIDMFIRKMKKEFETYGESTFTLEQLVLTCVDFTFPPSSASTAVLAMLVERVLVNPDIQRKIHEEIDAVVGRDRLPTLDDRRNMPYTEACLRETMRLESVVPLNLPHRAMHDTKLGGYDIPENTMVMLNLSAMHHDKELWGDPENFRPERFLDDSGKLCLSKDKSLPFGAGKRLCAGETYARQTLFSIFAGFMAMFNVSTADGKPQKKLRKRIPGITTTSQNYWVRVTPRNSVPQKQL